MESAGNVEAQIGLAGAALTAIFQRYRGQGRSYKASSLGRFGVPQPLVPPAKRATAIATFPL